MMADVTPSGGGGVPLPLPVARAVQDRLCHGVRELPRVSHLLRHCVSPVTESTDSEEFVKTLAFLIITMLTVQCESVGSQAKRHPEGVGQ